MSAKDLVPMNERTKGEQKKIAQKGGRASGRKRRQKKAMKEYFQMFKGMALTDKKIALQLEKAGVNASDATIGAAMAYMTIVKGMKGNSQMMRLAFEMMGEIPDTRMKIDSTVKNDDRIQFIEPPDEDVSHADD